MIPMWKFCFMAELPARAAAGGLPPRQARQDARATLRVKPILPRKPGGLRKREGDPAFSYNEAIGSSIKEAA